MNRRRCLLIAGEASGDTLAAELVLAMKAAGNDWEFLGAGGPRMAAAGVRLTVDLTRHAVVGIWEVVKHYPELRQLFRQLIELATTRLPDVIVLVDYPGFNLRYARAIQKIARSWRHRQFGNWHPKIVYYVSPQIWAWHASRVHQIARDVDLLLSIFPFEKAWYAPRAPRLRVEFVGHPLIDRHAKPAPVGPAPEQSASATKAPAQPLVLLLPGSRTRELNQHLPAIAAAVPQIEAACRVRWRLVLPSEKLAALAKTWLAALPQIEVRVGGLAESLGEAALAIASSGTVTMECAYFEVPTVVIYRVSWSTYRLGRWLVQVKYIAMPNLLADRAIYPELIQHDASPERIAKESITLLTDQPRRNEIHAALRQTIATLGEPGASHRAARIIQSLFQPAP